MQVRPSVPALSAGPLCRETMVAMASDENTDPLPRLDTSAVTTVVGATSASNGLKYSLQQRVGRVRFEPAEDEDAFGLLRAQVAGSAPRPYQVRVVVKPRYDEAFGEDPAEGPTYELDHGECTCPVGQDCKHAAAVFFAAAQRSLRARTGSAEAAQTLSPASLLGVPEGVAGEAGEAGEGAGAASGPTGGPRRAAADWRAVMEPLAGIDAAGARRDSQPALAIGVEMVAESARSTQQGWSPAGAGPERLRAGRGLFVLLRPLRRGSRGDWIKGGLTWRKFQYATGAHRPEHEAALRRIYRQLMAEDTYPTDAYVMLDAYESTRIWQLLADAVEAGVELVPQGALAEVVLEAPVQVGLDVAETSDGALALSPRLLDEDGEPAGQDVARLHPVRQIGFYRIDEDEDGGFVLRLVPVHRAVDAAVQHLCEGTEPVRVPAEDRAEFLERVYPRLKSRIDVASTDESVVLPEFEPPTLRLQATFHPDHVLQLVWSWLYFDPPREVEIDEKDALRDLAHEESVLREALAVWPRAARTGRQELDGVAAARFSEHVLPRLSQLDHVRVDVHGERPDYRELTAAPRIEVGTKAAQNDWFDLGVQVSVDGHVLPFSELFTALVHGKTTLILMDGSYLSLDHPAFDRLRALLSEAATLQEWTPEHQQVSKHQVGFWEELKELADEVDEDPAWTEAVGRLAAVEALPDPAPPAGLAAQLRPYQREGYRWLAFLHELGLGGILADDMGLGKTVQTLALLCHARQTDPDADPFLVVAPSSVVTVWAMEAKKFAPGLDVRVVDTTSRKRGTSVEAEVAGADVVVTSYTLLRIDAAEYQGRQWAGLVLDEAQFIKNRAAKVHQVARDVPAPFRLAITGTPMENSLSDLWALLNVAVPGLFPKHRLFREQYVNPIESGEHPERMEQLRRRLRPFMLRRSKELVAKDLPPKQEQVLHVELEPAHRKLYDRVLQRERRKVLGLLEDMDGNRFTIFKSLTLLRMLALAPQIVDDQYAPVPSSKMERFLDDLTEVIAEDHRVIVFSQFTSFLGALGEELTAMGVEHAYLDGSTRRRSEVIEGFRDGTAPVFLISLKAGGFGLTLTEADYVFLMDPWWNPAAEAQAVDRAHRIGQERTVMVYRMVSEGTIEEKVLQMQRRKAELFGALMDESGDSGAGAFADSLTAADVRELLGAE